MRCYAFYQRIASFIIILWSLCLWSLCPYANTISIENTDQSIKALYAALENKALTLDERLAYFSLNLLNKPYLNGALGEGSDGYYDQSPLYRLDAFDCETYVDTIIALTLGHDLSSFQYYIRQIRYKEGIIGFLTRNHFTSVDWNHNNQHQGFMKDITASIAEEAQADSGISILQNMVTVINKPAWYAHHTVNIIKLHQSILSDTTQRLAALKRKGAHTQAVISRLNYLPLTALFKENNEPNMMLFKKIPNASLIEIVRGGWAIKQTIGTDLDISHMGFAFWIHDELYFREASSTHEKTVQIKLIPYLQQALKSPSIKGINVQMISLHAAKPTETR